MESTAAQILLVEDSDEDFDTVLEAARRSEHRPHIVRAVDGENALERLHKDHPSAYRLVILDHNLPGALSGFDVLVAMRASTVLELLPTVMFTTSNSERDCQACYRAGANAYHVKSVGFNDCLRMLGTIFDYWLSSAKPPLTREIAR